MNKKLKTTSLLISLLIISAIIVLRSSKKNLKNTIWPKINSEITLNPEVEKQIKLILSKMTLEEKIGQMTQGEIQHVTPKDAMDYHLGSVLNGGGSFPNANKESSISDWVKLADSYYISSIEKSSNRIGVPIIWGTDAVHGHNNVIGATIFPHNIGLGAARDPKLVQKIGEATAKEVLATGINWIFAPTVAVARNYRWGRTYESYSEDPNIVKEYAKAMVYGLQGKGTETLNQNHVLSTVKHFIGDGGTEEGIDQGDNRNSEQKLLNIHGQGYISGLSAGAQVVMASFNSWRGEKLHGHKYLLTKVLKVKMGFDGFVIGDWNGHGQVKGCTNSSCFKAINAGVDMIMVPEDWKQFIANTVLDVKSKKISLERVNDAVTRILRVKARMGLLDAKAPSKQKFSGRNSIIGSKEHRSLAREAARKSLVLLKNKNSILPLSSNSKLLLTGSGADNIGQQNGGWTLSWQGTGNTNNDFPGATSIYDGFKKKIDPNYGSVELSKDSSFKVRPDVAIVVFGEMPYAEGQGDIKNLNFSKIYPENLSILKSLKQKNIPTVSVFLTGRPLWVNPEINNSDAFVVAWLPGSEGAAISDLLIASDNSETSYSFQGKLPFSWPKFADQVRLNFGQKNYNPLFPLGYGLTYKDKDTLKDNLSEVSDNELGSSIKLSIFSGRPIEPFEIFALESSNEEVKISNGVGSSKNNQIIVQAVDKNLQEDAREVHFKDKGSFIIKSNEAINLVSYLNANGFLEFDIMQHGQNSDLLLAVGGKSIGLDQYLIKDSWKRLQINLKCFSNLGSDFKNLKSVFSLKTNSRTKVFLANISYKTKENNESVIKCN